MEEIFLHALKYALKKEQRMVPISTDPTSYANFNDYQVEHVHFKWNVDFDRVIIKGQATLTIVEKNISVKKLILDTRELKINSVCNAEDKKSLKFSLDPVKIESFGSRLTICLPETHTGNKIKIIIDYETTPTCSALQWLNKEQTSGKQHPYLFSQCQAIHARSLFPCQDTPAVKFVYDAEVSVKSPLVALMSAVRQESNDCDQKTGFNTFKFCQKVPIPSYLVAIVVGALESRQIGPRSHVWAEKELIEKAAYEFAETENMLKIAEDLMGPYVWGAYDILVLPPSFPFGGMENPCLTFVTPTLLAGDRSLASVIAHEITHSWTGNLATNATFEHFWLNEGHTTFIERKICGRLFKSEPYRHFMALNGWKGLQYNVERFGDDHPYTKLVVHLENVDPDEVFSSIPYEKGHTLLFYLEQKLGGNEQFEKFLRFMVERFKFKSFVTSDWKDCLYEFFKDKKDILDSVDWSNWFGKPGMPIVKPDYDESLARASYDLCDRWVNAFDDKSALEKFTGKDLETLTALQVQEFVAQLVLKKPLPLTAIQRMADVYKFTDSKNFEILFHWLRLAIKATWEPIIAPALKFVTDQGRMKYTLPVYRDLYGWEKAREKTIENFKSNRQFMHGTTAGLVAKELHV